MHQSRIRLHNRVFIYKKGKADPFLIIDTKWKTPDSGYPSDEDLRQIYAYLKMWKCSRGILLYPGNEEVVSGIYEDGDGLVCEQRRVGVMKKNNSTEDLINFT